MKKRLNLMIKQYGLNGDEIHKYLKYKKKMNQLEINWFEASMFLPDSFERDIKKRVEFVDQLQEIMTGCLQLA